MLNPLKPGGNRHLDLALFFHKKYTLSTSPNSKKRHFQSKISS